MFENQSQTAILLLACPDQLGLVAELTTLIYKHRGNVTHLEQAVDAQSGRFFMRMAWSLESFALSEKACQDQISHLASQYALEWQLHWPKRQHRLGILVSQSQHCLFELLHHHHAGTLQADIAFVGSNHPDHEPLCTSFGIPYHHCPVTPDTQAQQEQLLLTLCQDHDIDTLILARYMQILSPKLIEPYRYRIINIHHSFLPAFAGAKPYHRAHARGVKLIGATSHYVTEDLDEGPIIAQDVIPITHHECTQTLIQRGREVEKRVLMQAIHSHTQHKIWVDGSRTIVYR